ncbi:hypothetical protein SAMN05421837_103243 [Amycolatopsis pretoriensis]|uniref:Uncharacterized protein n=1 Tax=Amycolatopsis pretoriensis TaxID=218821 RepID=A0A1H5QJN3_9PSEU|nr:hypothetical protein [Amycolatopsis pretoriensis]SEF26372.1 hypothetical protein SAMN05421837_103243 [Amycolatopsis pretoriensis]
MGSLVVPVENTVCALRRLAPGAALRSPASPDLRVLARALRACAPAELASARPGTVVRVVLAAQSRALDRAMTGLFGSEAPEAARLVRAARFSGRGPQLSRVRAEPGLRAAALGWASATGARLLAASLRGVPLVPDAADGRHAAELAVAALLPRASADGEAVEVAGVAGFLEARSLRVGDGGFRVDVLADPPVELAGDAPVLRALWWNGLGRVTDDLGYEYLIVGKDPEGTGVVRHWCHPRPAPGATVLRLESAGYRGESLRLASAVAHGTSAEVLVKRELTVRLADAPGRTPS